MLTILMHLLTNVSMYSVVIYIIIHVTTKLLLDIDSRIALNLFTKKKLKILFSLIYYLCHGQIAMKFKYESEGSRMMHSLKFIAVGNEQME